MRSEAMAWLFSLGDIKTEILEGGYKSYRHHILEKLSEKRKMIVLGGLTGSGKTEILKYLKTLDIRSLTLKELPIIKDLLLVLWANHSNHHQNILQIFYARN